MKFKVDTDRGMAIYNAEDADSARKEAQRDVGVSNVRSISPATEQDIAWYTAMGGKA